MHRRCSVVETDDGWKDLVLHIDELGPVLGEVLALGHHHSDRFADEPNLVEGHDIAAVGAVVRQLDLRGDRLHHSREICAGEDFEHTLQGERFADVDRRDAGVGVGAEHELHVRGLGRDGHIVEVPALTAQQLVVLAPWNALPNEVEALGGGLVVAHASPLRRISTAEAATASTMFA